MRPSQSYCITLLLTTALCTLAASAWSADAAVTPTAVSWPTSGWQQSTPEQQGMGSAALLNLVDFGAKNDMDSLLVVRHGKLVVDAYYGPFRSDLKHTINSATKAVVGTLTGMAIKDGHLKSVNQPVVDFFAEQTIANLDADKKAIHIAHLLDMNSGIDWTEPLSDVYPQTMVQMGLSPNWTSFVLDRPMAQAPGTAFNYNSGTWQLMSAVLTKVTGVSTADYARQKLFEPLGISDVRWNADPQGISTGGFGLYMHPRDMAKIGYLYLHNGKWQDQALLPLEWSDKVFHHADVDMPLGKSPAFHYANGWWTIPERNVIMAVGYHRQLIVVLPKLDMVAVVTGKTHYAFGPLIDLLERSVVSDLALPANPEVLTQLSRRVRDVATEKASAVQPASAMAGKISGRLYRFDRNAQGLSTLKLDLTGANPQYELQFNPGNPFLRGQEHQVGPIGLSGVYQTNDDTTGPTRAVKAYWTDASTLAMDYRWLSDGTTVHYSLHFSDDAVDAEFTDSHGVRTQLHGTSAP